MAADDFKTFVARQSLQQLDANRAQCLADLAAAEANGDYETGKAAVREIAKIEEEKGAIIDLHQRYVASQTPVQAPELTQEERHAKPWDRMDYGDVWEMCQNSEHGVDENAFRAGMAEVARRRARGE